MNRKSKTWIAPLKSLTKSLDQYIWDSIAYYTKKVRFYTERKGVHWGEILFAYISSAERDAAYRRIHYGEEEEIAETQSPRKAEGDLVLLGEENKPSNQWQYSGDSAAHFKSHYWIRKGMGSFSSEFTSTDSAGRSIYINLRDDKNRNALEIKPLIETGIPYVSTVIRKREPIWEFTTPIWLPKKEKVTANISEWIIGLAYFTSQDFEKYKLPLLERQWDWEVRQLEDEKKYDYIITQEPIRDYRYWLPAQTFVRESDSNIWMPKKSVDAPAPCDERYDYCRHQLSPDDLPKIPKASSAKTDKGAERFRLKRDELCKQRKELYALWEKKMPHPQGVSLGEVDENGRPKKDRIPLTCVRCGGGAFDESNEKVWCRDCSKTATVRRKKSWDEELEQSEKPSDTQLKIVGAKKGHRARPKQALILIAKLLLANNRGWQLGDPERLSEAAHAILPLIETGDDTNIIAKDIAEERGEKIRKFEQQCETLIALQKDYVEQGLPLPPVQLCDLITLAKLYPKESGRTADTEKDVQALIDYARQQEALMNQPTPPTDMLLDLILQAKILNIPDIDGCLNKFICNWHKRAKNEVNRMAPAGAER